MSSSWKLTAGRLLKAWRNYPEARSQTKKFPAGAPILLTGTHRSGTTWAAKMLAEPGLWYIHEPFNPNKDLWPEVFSYANIESNRPDIDKYVSELLNLGHRQTSNNLHTDHPLMPQRLIKPSVQRILIKDPIGCLLTGYLACRFNFRTLVLFRHPAGFVASVMRLGWPLGEFLAKTLKDGNLMSDHLQPFAELMARNQHKDDIESATVLHGVLNTVLWNQVQDNPEIRYYLFEDLCLDPIAQFEIIFNDLDLPYTKDTKARHQKLCNAPAKEPDQYHPHAVVRNSAAMARNWTSQLSNNEIECVKQVWAEFKIPLYRESSDWS